MSTHIDVVSARDRLSAGDDVGTLQLVCRAAEDLVDDVGELPVANSDEGNTREVDLSRDRRGRIDRHGQVPLTAVGRE
jgi:hypothetical protein